jgi:hypothetical protein
MAILTDKRRQVLRGKHKAENSTIRSHKSKIRQAGRDGIQDLIEIAESDEIDNEDVFDPEAIDRLLRAIVGDIDPPLYERENPSEEMVSHDYERQMTKAIRRVAQDYDDDLSFSEPAHLRRSGDGGGVE